MTVSYSGGFIRLLFFWKGSVWKTVWKELTVWLILYYLTRFIIQYGVSNNQSAAEVVNLFSEFTTELPIEFMLGFYVAQVLNRWWAQILLVPWPDEAISLVNGALHKSDRESRLRRHAIARYLILCQVLALRKVSVRVRKRFPTMEHIVNAGLMTKEEYQSYNNTVSEHVRWQLPLAWAQNIITCLVGIDADSISPVIATNIFNELNKYRASLRNVLTYDWICIPLVLTQAVGVGLYGYFGLSLIGRQFIGKPIDAYIPFLTILKFIFYVGWFKVAQDLMRPFGEDDDDVELNYLIERHLQVVITLADQACEQNFELQTDKFFDCKTTKLPHTKLSAMVQDRPPVTHDVAIDVKQIDLFEVVHVSLTEIPDLKDLRKNTNELLQF